MTGKQFKKLMLLTAGSVVCFGVAAVAHASGAASVSGIGAVAQHVTDNLANVAKLITAGAYVAGFGFAVGAIVKFKAHKDQPTQVPISLPIALLFVAAALIFLPSVFKTTGATMGLSGKGSVSGATTF